MEKKPPALKEVLTLEEKAKELGFNLENLSSETREIILKCVEKKDFRARRTHNSSSGTTPAYLHEEYVEVYDGFVKRPPEESLWRS